MVKNGSASATSNLRIIFTVSFEVEGPTTLAQNRPCFLFPTTGKLKVFSYWGRYVLLWRE